MGAVRSPRATIHPASRRRRLRSTRTRRIGRPRAQVTSVEHLDGGIGAFSCPEALRRERRHGDDVAVRAEVHDRVAHPRFGEARHGLPSGHVVQRDLIAAVEHHRLVTGRRAVHAVQSGPAVADDSEHLRVALDRVEEVSASLRHCPRGVAPLPRAGGRGRTPAPPVPRHRRDGRRRSSPLRPRRCARPAASLRWTTAMTPTTSATTASSEVTVARMRRRRFGVSHRPVPDRAADAPLRRTPPRDRATARGP